VIDHPPVGIAPLDDDAGAGFNPTGPVKGKGTIRVRPLRAMGADADRASSRAADHRKDRAEAYRRHAERTHLPRGADRPGSRLSYGPIRRWARTCSQLAKSGHPRNVFSNLVASPTESSARPSPASRCSLVGLIPLACRAPPVDACHRAGISPGRESNHGVRDGQPPSPPVPWRTPTGLRPRALDGCVRRPRGRTLGAC
jgi:hypothetical protein